MRFCHNQTVRVLAIDLGRKRIGLALSDASATRPVITIRALGPAGLAASTAPAADAMRALVGSAGERIVTAGIAVSTFGFLNLVILVSPRVYQAMAADGLFFPALSRLHPRYRTPTAAYGRVQPVTSHVPIPPKIIT